MLDKATFDKVQIGQMIYFVSGPGQFPQDEMCGKQGPVIAKEETRWGYSLKVQTGPGEFETASHLNPLTGKGIGAYADI